MKNVKKILAVVMAVAMLFALGLNAFAATSDPYLVVGPNTLYSTPITANTSVMLTVTTADSSWHRTGFSSATDAVGGICATVTVGSDKVSVSSSYGYELFTNYYNSSAYLATISVTGESNAYGPASIHVQKSNDATAYIDLTVYVEPSTVQNAVNGISVEVVDIQDYTMYEYADSLTVKAAAAESCAFTNMSGAAQNYPTAADALAKLVSSTSGMSLIAYDGYVDAITDSNNTTLAGYYDQLWVGHGWNYCIVRNGAIVAHGDIFSAAVMPIETGDAVYWAFGTSNDANAYFAALVS